MKTSERCPKTSQTSIGRGFKQKQRIGRYKKKIITYTQMTRYELLTELRKYTSKRDLDWYMTLGWDNELLLKLLVRKINDISRN
jgi:hypothetical protein